MPQAPPEPLSYATAAAFLRVERASNKIQPLPPNFWDLLRAWESELANAVRAAAQQEGVLSPAFRNANSLLDNVNQLAQDLWGLRERKLIMRMTVRNVSADDLAAMTPNEKALLEELRDALFRYRPTREKAVMPAGT